MTVPLDGEDRATALAARFTEVRAATLRLAAPLSDEDCVVQSMPDASPVKWHLAHTTWFFEAFVLAPLRKDYRPIQPGWDHLFNSYYEAMGSRHPRPQRGMLTRPSMDEVRGYRAAIDAQIRELLDAGPAPKVLDIVELGLHHERQHQELILTDLLHALSANPLGPAYQSPAPPLAVRAPAQRWIAHDGGLCSIGHAGAGFAFDNERPAHRVHLEPFAIASRQVTNAEFQAFIGDNGYQRPQLWLSDGWAQVTAQHWEAPLYWERRDGAWRRFSLYGWTDIDPHAPVSHVSYYEADAYARWAGLRLPTEAEWETVARTLPLDGQFMDDGMWLPVARPESEGLTGGVWTWTASPYVPYPGFVPFNGAASEYNGKFMVNQMVLRGGSCFSARDHLRYTYRNFFPPHARWQMTGIRLART